MLTIEHILVSPDYSYISYKFHLSFQVKKIQLPDHEKEFTTLHLKIALNKIVTFQNELSKTQNELNTTKATLTNISNQLSTTRDELWTTLKELSTTRNDLLTTRDELSTTHDKLSTTLSTTREELSTTRKELSTLRNELSTTTKYRGNIEKISSTIFTTRDELSTTRDELSKTQNELSKTRDELKEIHPILIMTQLLRPTELNTTQQTYTSNLRRLFYLIQIGEIQHINANECFFKINIPQIYQNLYINHHHDVIRSKRTIFNNDFIALDDRGICFYYYHLRLSIETYDDENSQCFLVDITKSGCYRLLEYSTYNSFDDWSVYRNDKKEVILFYFKKK